MASGVKANEQCILEFNNLKLKNEYKYIVYSLSPDNKEIIIASKESKDASVDNQTAYNKFVGLFPEKEPRYGVFDFEFEKEDGSGKRNRIVFVSWAPDDAPVKLKMVYATSKDALLRSLVGIQISVQAAAADELSYEDVLKSCDKLR